jgi:1,4-dihydroxy-2-naphthoyl-CoA synthase
MALDFLSMPVSGVGPENLFLVAQDICHYCRNYLSNHIIKVIMVQLYADYSVINKEYQQLCKDIDRINNQALSCNNNKELDTLPEAGYISNKEGLVGDNKDAEEDYF